MSKTKNVRKYTNSIKKRLTQTLMITIILGIFVTIAVVISLYVYYFRQARTQTIDSIVTLVKQNMFSKMYSKSRNLQNEIAKTFVDIDVINDVILNLKSGTLK